MFDQQVNLLIYDYNIVGTRLGTHTAVFVYDEEFWFSIEGIKVIMESKVFSNDQK